MQQLSKFEKWVKIRIGEPITAIDLNNEYLIFGSISGYVGFYNITKSQLNYIQEIFDEIIRGIHIKGDKAYFSVGDLQGLIMNIDKREWDIYKYGIRIHNATVCSSTLAMLCESKVVLLTVAPTQNKDLVIDISTKKNSIYLSDMDMQDTTHFYMEMPTLCVPFDFDGQRILLLEYLKKAKKKMLIYEFGKQTLDVVYLVPDNVEFISHGRLVKNFMVYVEDHKKVKCYDLITKQNTLLFTMDAQIIAFDVVELDTKVQLDEESKSEVKLSEVVGNMATIQISAVDYYADFKSMVNLKVVQHFNLLKVPNVHPDLVKHKYIFDMGYPYYMRVRQNRVAVTSDLGILVYSI